MILVGSFSLKLSKIKIYVKIHFCRLYNVVDIFHPYFFKIVDTGMYKFVVN
jgi:hypothetical protein